MFTIVVLVMLLLFAPPAWAALPVEWHADSASATAPYGLSSVGPVWGTTKSLRVTRASAGIPAIISTTTQTYVLNALCEAGANFGGAGSAACSGRILVYYNANPTDDVYMQMYFYLPTTGLLVSSGTAAEWQKFFFTSYHNNEGPANGMSAWVELENYPKSGVPYVHGTNYGLVYFPAVSGVSVTESGAITGNAWHLLELHAKRGNGSTTDLMEVWLDRNALTQTPSYTISGGFFNTSGAAGAHFNLMSISNNWISWLSFPTQSYYVDYIYAQDGASGPIGDRLGFLVGPPAPDAPGTPHTVGPTSSTGATIIWPPSTDPLLAGYKVYRSTTSGVYGAPLQTITLASAAAAHSPPTRYIDTKLTAANTYYYVVTTYLTNGFESAPSSEVTVVATGLSRMQVGHGARATDPFTGTAATLGGNWSDNSANVMKLASGIATATSTASDSAARYSAITWPADQYSTVVHSKVLVTGGLGAGYGACVRMSTTGATVSYYRGASSSAGWEILKQVNNSPTSLASSATPAFVDGDSFSLEVQGNLITAKRNGVVIGSATDTSLATGAAGICYSSTGGDATFGIASWEGGSLQQRTAR